MHNDFRALLALAFGAFVQGLAMAFFLFPFEIASGGAAGIAILFERWFEVSYALTIWGMNITLLMLAIRWIGIKSCMKTVYTVSITSLTLWFTEYIQISWNLPMIMSMVIGAVLFGIGVGLLFRFGASSGGLAIIAHILFVVAKILPGKSMFWMNLIVFSLVAYVIDWQLFIYAVITQWVATKVLNQVVLYRSSLKTKENTSLSA
ncbi:hypothetical protein BkAM31D_03460 [Halalkalibacter krulwichiae]|uniref:YitT family protein n=2 Tax=Halalkalibacter krulwichiae TaxID=199441 RepID=A0A1X9MEX6_9BACI|nr:hypothetical protein BkAM31D_03460 [Halalkalibacter krulwichiae]